MYRNMECPKIHVKDLMILRGHPCKVMEVNISKTGKHGHAKHHFIGIDIFTAKKYEEIIKAHEMVQIPIVSKQTATIIHLEKDGHVSLLLSDGTTRYDLQLDEEMYEKVKTVIEGKSGVSKIQVVIQSAMGLDSIICFKCLGD